MSRKSYFTIAVDVKGSTLQEFVTKDLVAVATLLNKELNLHQSKDCLIPFKIRRGDEMLAVFSSFSEGYKAYFELYSLLNGEQSNGRGKISAYIGLGLGYIDDDKEADLETINGSSISSAFRARDFYLKQNKSYSRQYNHYNKSISSFVYSLDDKLPCEAVNHLISYINETCERRTEKQKEVIRLIEINPHITSLEIASITGNAESSVYKIIQRSNYQLVKDAQFSLGKLLDYIQTHYHGGDEDV